MASVEEIFDSRTGSSIGFEGPAGVSRTFRVVIDDPEHDPRAVLYQKIPQGTPHPTVLGRTGIPGNPRPVNHWADGTVADRAEIVKREVSTRWLVRMIYSRPVAAAISSGPLSEWTYSTRSYVENVKILEEVPFDANGDPASSKLIGPLEYKKFTPTEGVTPDFTSQINATTTINLKQQLTRRVIGADVPVAAMQLILRKRLPNWGLAANYQIVGGYVKKLNKDEFLEVPPGHMRFESIDVNQIVAVVTGQLTKNVAYDLTANFVVRFKPFSPLELVSTFVDTGTGAESVVLNDEGDKVVEEFRVAEFRDFQTIFTIIDRAAR